MVSIAHAEPNFAVYLRVCVQVKIQARSAGRVLHECRHGRLWTGEAVVTRFMFRTAVH